MKNRAFGDQGSGAGYQAMGYKTVLRDLRVLRGSVLRALRALRGSIR